MGLFNDWLNDLCKSAERTSKFLNDPQQCGHEDARENHKDSSPAELIELAAKAEAENKKSWEEYKAGDWRGKNQAAYQAGKQNELKSMLDEKITQMVDDKVKDALKDKSKP